MLRVNVSFVGSKIIPVSFVVDGREHRVRHITLQFWRKDGGRKYLCFAVSTEGLEAELAWDITSLNWKLMGTACD